VSQAVKRQMKTRSLQGEKRKNSREKWKREKKIKRGKGAEVDMDREAVKGKKETKMKQKRLQE
jgi:hypothetical protein